MTIAECEARNNAIKKAWEEWKNGENTLENLDCAILAEMFSINYPMACQRYLESTSGRNSARILTTNKQALKTIFAFLDKLYNIKD